jgi:hypothetical protein
MVGEFVSLTCDQRNNPFRRIRVLTIPREVHTHPIGHPAPERMMTPTALNPRLALQVRLALCPTDPEVAGQASRAGLTGAEIDAVRDGRCFDVQAQAAIALALTIRAGGATDAARCQAERFGLCISELAAIAALAREG